MKLARRKPEAPQPPPEERPALPFAPWRVPPPGSLGDAWDAEIVLPQDPVEQPPPPPRRKKRDGRRRTPHDVLFREMAVRLHWGVAVAWVLVALGAFSTGAAYPLMPLFGLAAIFVAGFVVWRLREGEPTVVGRNHAFASGAAGLLLILLDAVHPKWKVYDAWFTTSLGGAGKAMTFEQKLAYADKFMPLMAKAALCGRQYIGPSVVGVGRDGANRDVKGESEYFRISTLARLDDRTFGGIGKDSLVYNAEHLPPDPFADDPRATFGVFVTEKYVLVYSAGPDGAWQINPREPVATDSADPRRDLADSLYDPVTGSVGPGDIVRVYPIDDEGFDFFCDEVRMQFEDRVWTGSRGEKEE